MEFFGHVGLTLGAAYTVDLFVNRQANLTGGATGGRSVLTALQKRLRLPTLRNLDYRAVIMGSLLPDLIDKPLGVLLRAGIINESVRTLGHSVLFAVVMLLLAWTAFRLRWSRAGMALTLSSAGHLVLDQMWTEPRVALWPAFGWEFPEGRAAAFSEWSSSHLGELLEFYTEPAELAGAIIIVLFLGILVRRRAFLQFLRSGAAA